MTMPSNSLQSVRTFVDAELGLYQNINPFTSPEVVNTEYSNFQDQPANLGTSIRLQLPYTPYVNAGIKPKFQALEQNYIDLTVDQAWHNAIGINNFELIYNLKPEEYMNKYGKAAMKVMGDKVGSIIAKNANSSVPVQTVVDGELVATGDLHTESGPYLFYGSQNTAATVAINTDLQLKEAVTAHLNIGCSGSDICMIIPDMAADAILTSMLSQYAGRRNDAITAPGNPWELPDLMMASRRIKIYTSNLLPQHVAGACGNDSTGHTLTIQSLTVDADGGISAIVARSSLTSQSGALKSGDLIEFADAGSLRPRYKTHMGDIVSSNKIQIRVTADCDTDGSGDATIPITPKLYVAPGIKQNVNVAIVAGMTMTVMPSHRCGLIISDRSLYGCMPKLPETDPFESFVQTDPETNTSMRFYRGWIMDQGVKGCIRDLILGTLLVPKNSRRMLFPTTV
jgi:hypothetical protein